MNKLKEYDIAFGGLKNGNHEFSYDLDNTFFELFENTDIKDGTLKTLVSLKKDSTLLTFTFYINGKVTVECDNCLDLVELESNTQSDLYVKFGADYEEQDDNIIVIPFESHEFNVAQIIYELIVVNLPLKRVHPLDENGESLCNPDMVNELSHYLVSEVDEDDEEYTSQNEDKEIDPRWNALKNLIDKDKNK